MHTVIFPLIINRGLLLPLSFPLPPPQKNVLNSKVKACQELLLSWD